MIKKVFRKIFKYHYIAKCRYLKYLEKSKINDKSIFLESQQGKCFNGNIYYLLKELVTNDDYKDYNIYLAVNADVKDKAVEFYKNKNLSGFKFVTSLTKPYYVALSSSKYLMNDNTFRTFFIKKEGQVYLNTWHGTPLKTLGKQILNDAHNIGNTQRNFVASDFLLYPNDYTKQHMVEDYMLSNLADNTILIDGYPRNTAFFDEEMKAEIRGKYNLNGKQAIAYMPTWRGSLGKQNTSIMQANYEYIFEELDKRLNENQVVYVNLHPIEKATVDLTPYTKIKPFPEEYETYEFLNACDILVSDYSSVFFDFLNTGKKIILYAFDKEFYFSDRGVYMPLEDFPFPIVEKMQELVEEINKPKEYDDEKVRKMFCAYDSKKASKEICKRVVLNEKVNIKEEKMPNNGKENVFIFAGRLANNGVTASLRNLIKSIDLDKRNYFLSMRTTKAVRSNLAQLNEFSQYVDYFPIKGNINLTLTKKIIWLLEKEGLFPNSLFLKLMKKEYEYEYKRMFGGSRIDTFIHFTGYKDSVINLISQFSGNKVIYVHADMKKEIETRGNQSKNVLHDAYCNYDHVAVVTKGMIDSTASISGKKENICVCKNLIDYKTILSKSMLDFELGEKTTVYPNVDKLNKVLNSDSKKFINIGRFSPEKGQLRLIDAFSEIHKSEPNTDLIIIGGSSYGKHYDIIKEHIEELGLESNVVLIKDLPNPFSVLKKCDYFVLSSFYEGFGLVIAEADVLNKPVISTDIDGPRAFMTENNGAMVENTTEGLLKGMQAMLKDEVKPMNVDYEKYNQSAIAEFESLFN